MLVVNTRQFRDNPISYLNRVDNGEDFLIKRGPNKSYKIIPVGEDDALMSKEEYFAKIDKALEEVQEGKGIAMLPEESLDDFLNRVQGNMAL